MPLSIREDLVYDDVCQSRYSIPDARYSLIENRESRIQNRVRKEMEYEKAWRSNHWLRVGGGRVRKGLSKR
jgi:hypothetical protein